MNLSRDPNPSTRPRMDHALCAHPSCLPLRGLLPAEAPAWNTLGSPHPTPPNLQTQWARTTAAQDHGERDHCPISPHCCRNRVPVVFTWIQHLVTWARWEGRTQNRLTQASCTETEEGQPRATWICSQRPPHLAWHYSGKGNRSLGVPNLGRGEPSSSRNCHMETPPPATHTPQGRHLMGSGPTVWPRPTPIYSPPIN